jgi:hypothetical protein
MNITYAEGAEHPTIERILSRVARTNVGATAAVTAPFDTEKKPIPNYRQVVFTAPYLDLWPAVPQGLTAAEIEIRGLSSKRSGANTVVTVTYKLG